MSRLRKLFSGFRDGGAGAPRAEGDADRSRSDSGGRWLVAGLGNPGGEYRLSRHNVGFMVVDQLAEANRIELTRRKFNAEFGEGELAGSPVLLVKPQTFMNNSGHAVAPMLNYFKLTPQRLIVVHDELDLEAQRLRLKRGGGSAGNNGIRSIIAALGTEDFIRVRVGIGRSPEGEDGIGYLLRAMRSAEIEALKKTIERAAAAVECIIADGLERAMNQYNQKA